MARPERKPTARRKITSGEAMRILRCYSYSTLYSYVDSGDLHASNSLPPGKRTGRKKRTLKFDAEEVRRLAAALERDDDPGAE